MQKQNHKNKGQNNSQKSIGGKDRANKFNGDMEKAMETSLIKAGFKSNRIKNTLPSSPMIWKGEGVDHLNLNVGSEDMLSRAMTLEHASVINHPVFGRFQSIVGLQGYITAKMPDENFRTMRGIALVNAIRQNGQRTGRHQNTPNLNAILAVATWDKVSKSDKISRLLRESVLPFDSWYVSRGDTYGMRNRAKSAFWYVPVVEEIRKALRENREPNFEFLMDRVNPMTLEISYQFILNRMRDVSDDLKPAPLAKMETPAAAAETIGVVKKRSGSKHAEAASVDSPEQEREIQEQYAKKLVEEEKAEAGNCVDGSTSSVLILDPADTGADVLMEQFKKEAASPEIDVVQQDNYIDFDRPIYSIGEPVAADLDTDPLRADLVGLQSNGEEAVQYVAHVSAKLDEVDPEPAKTIDEIISAAVGQSDGSADVVGEDGTVPATAAA